MNYHVLLTGATGLLGRYLLRDLLTAGVPVAAVARSKRRQSAETRVEAMMRTWERLLGRSLPRPVVLEGDISEPHLGLDEDEVRWVTENCDSCLHNAASLTFHATGPESEPWRSNVGGTRNILGLCRDTGIRDFHHVSTSYVCGLRHGTVLETDLDVGQEFGNDYEKSKVQAEKMVHDADFLSPPTIFRPAIIIGDSKSGFTTTFHGFYAMMNLVHMLAASAEIAGNEWFREKTVRLTLDGTERKNLVPVDWVSAVIAHVFTNPQHHGKTYHLTPRKPVTVGMLRDVVHDVLGVQNTKFCGHGSEIDDATEVERLFYEHLRVYDSYWRDDPVFDSTHTQSAAAHLPCPTVDEDLLKRLAHKAIEMDFRFNDAPVPETTEVASH